MADDENLRVERRAIAFVGDVAEQAFFMCGGLEDVDKKWEQLQKDL